MISVVIPTLNEEKCMGPLLQSLRPQLHPDDEVIVVDSYSKDKTCLIARRFGCRILEVPPGGIAAAKNAGAKKAKNRIIAFLDADSTVSRHWLEKIRHHFRYRRIEGVAGLDLYRAPSHSRELMYNAYSRSVFQTAQLFYGMGGKPWMPANNCAVDRRLFLKIGGYADVICEDAELTRRWPAHAKVHYDPAMVVHLSDRRFRKEGFKKTLATWLIADVKAWLGKGIHARKYSKVRI